MKNIIKEFSILFISSLLTAMAVQFFFSNHALTPGGITGMAISVSSLVNIPVDIISLSISVPLLIISTIFLGGKFGIKTLFVTLTIPLCLRIVPQINVTSSLLLASIGGGILVGLSIALAIYCKCATGGTDIIAMLIHLIVKNIEIPNILFVLDMLIVLSSWYISKNFMTSIYSAISLFVIMQTIKITTKVLNHE